MASVRLGNQRDYSLVARSLTDIADIGHSALEPAKEPLYVCIYFDDEG